MNYAVYFGYKQWSRLGFWVSIAC